MTVLRAALWNTSAGLSVYADGGVATAQAWSLVVRPAATVARTSVGGAVGSGRHGVGELPGVTVPMLLEALCVPTLDFLKMCAPAAPSAAHAAARGTAHCRAAPC